MLSDINLSAIGMDLGDTFSQFCALDEAAEIVEEGRLRTIPEVLTDWFSKIKQTRVAIEAGSLSPWVSRVLTRCGHEAVVGNPRKVRLIGENRKKTDRADAQLLARLARSDPKLLSPITHRGKQAQADLWSLRSRDLLVRTRTGFINHVRSILKGCGIRPPKCSARGFHKTVPDLIPNQLRHALSLMVDRIAYLTRQINAYDKYVTQVAEKRYPETARVSHFTGVGPLTAPAFVLTIEDLTRCPKSRAVGTFFGLCPRSDRSSGYNPQLRISKEGNDYVQFLQKLRANVDWIHYDHFKEGDIPRRLKHNTRMVVLIGGPKAPGSPQITEKFYEHNPHTFMEMYSGLKFGDYCLQAGYEKVRFYYLGGISKVNTLMAAFRFTKNPEPAKHIKAFSNIK